MITITTIEGSRYRVEYRLQGTLVATREGELATMAILVKEFMAHMRCLAQGKTVPVPSPEKKG